jgi:hypothetical protein
MLLGLAMGALLACSACSSNGSNGGNAGDASSGQCDQGGADSGGVCYPGLTPDFTSCAPLTKPTVSFGKDIVPIFETKCGVNASCHGDPVAPLVGQPFLGLAKGGTDPSMVIRGIVGVRSPEAPSVDIVKPGDPANSYMMHKLDGDQCQFASACNAQNMIAWTACGLQMPIDSVIPLCLDSQAECVSQQALAKQYGYRDQIRRWIAQGAANN